LAWLVLPEQRMLIITTAGMVVTAVIMEPAMGTAITAVDMEAAVTTLARTISISLSNARGCVATGTGNAPDITATERSNGTRVCTSLKRWQIAVDTDERGLGDSAGPSSPNGHLRARSRHCTIIRWKTGIRDSLP